MLYDCATRVHGYINLVLVLSQVELERGMTASLSEVIDELSVTLT
jgi:hypothetical protein